MNLLTWGGLWNWHMGNQEVMNPLDTIIMLFYLMLILSITLWALMSSSRGTVEDFFLAGRNLAWCKIGTSLFASYFGIVQFLRLSGLAATSGIAVGAIEWNAIFFLCCLAWLFVPIYRQAKVVTMPEYLRRRFQSCRIQLLLAVLYLFLCIFHMFLAELCTGTMLLKVIWGMNSYLTALFLLIVVGTGTITGGLISVVYNDTLHAGMMAVGSFLLMVIALKEVGGYQQLVHKYFKARPKIISEGNWTTKQECYIPQENALHIFQDAIEGDFPWPGIIFGVSIMSFFQWCNNQIFIQKVLAGKNMNHVKGGCVFCGFLMVVTVFSIVMPGMISRILFADQVACVVPSQCESYCGNETGCSFIGYPMLILQLLPLGLRGLIMSTLWAALISSLTSAINCASTLFTVDIYTQLRPLATEKELMVTGRFFTLALLALTLTVFPLIYSTNSLKLFEFTKKVSEYMAPPIAATFLLALFSTRVTEKGAFWGMSSGLLIGFIRLVLDLVFLPRNCSEKDTCPVFICRVHYFYFVIFLFLTSMLIIWGISSFTEPVPEEYLHQLCWHLRNSKEERGDRELPRTGGRGDVYADVYIEEKNCRRKIWDIFCGLELGDYRTSEESAREKADYMGKQKHIFEGTVFGDLILKDGKDTTSVTKDREAFIWKHTINASGILLLLVIVICHIYYF